MVMTAIDEARRIRVVMVDDHAVVRVGYRTVLGNATGIEIVAEADSGEAGFLTFVEHDPDIVIMDISLPGISGFEAIRRIVARSSAAKILAFSMHEDTAFVEQALQAGARGYVGISSAPIILVEAVQQIAAGNIYLEPEIAQRLAFQKTRGQTSPFANLSTREFEIFCLLAEGLSASDIGSRLSLSAKTVANYSTQTKSKLEVKSIAEIARIAIRHGVVDA